MAEGDIAEELARLGTGSNRNRILLNPSGAFTSADLECIKKRHPFLSEYPDSILASVNIDTLLNLEKTSLKLKNLEKSKDVEDRLAMNREALGVVEYKVVQGVDDRWFNLHRARFLPGAACSAAKLWLAARESWNQSEHPPVAVYDMAVVGLAGHVTPKGWVVLADPGNSSISLNLFSINNCGKKVACKQGDFREEEYKEIVELGELKCALRVLREALSFVHPWNKSVSAIEGFLCASDFCSTDLANMANPAALLSQYIDYVLRENSNRWRGKEVFMDHKELKGGWDAYFGSRPQASLAKSKAISQSKGSNQPFQQKFSQQQNQVKMTAITGQQGVVPVSLFLEDMCVMYNLGRCVKPQGTCKTKKGRVLRHCCNFRPDPSKPNEYCGLNHAACFFH